MGIDPIIRMDSCYVLSEDLRDYLSDFGLHSLQNARNLGVGINRQSYWLSAEDLDLGGRWKEECDYYIKGLLHGGIRLAKQNDSLLHNPKNGEVTISLAYDLIVSSTLQLAQKKSILRIWACTIPLKIDFFIWISMENHI